MVYIPVQTVFQIVHILTELLFFKFKNLIYVKLSFYLQARYSHIHILNYSYRCYYYKKSFWTFLPGIRMSGKGINFENKKN